MSESQQRLLDLGWSASTARAFAPYEAFHQPARVCGLDDAGALLIGGGGAVRASYGGALLHDCAFDRSAAPAVGDWAAVRDWPDDRVTLEALLPRQTAIVPSAADGAAEGQTVAANVDLLGIVDDLDPAPDLTRIERLLALARRSGAVPLVVLTKADLVPDPARVRAEVAAAVTGVEVIALSAVTGDGLEALHAHLLPGRTLALAGPSGAGTSTLANLLAGADVMATAAVPGRELTVLPGRGVLIDTPGLRASAILT